MNPFIKKGLEMLGKDLKDKIEGSNRKWKETYNDRLGACIDVDGKLYNSNSNLAVLALIDVHNKDINELEIELKEAKNRAEIYAKDAEQMRGQRDEARKERDKFKQKLELYKAREESDIETMHECAEAISYRRRREL